MFWDIYILVMITYCPGLFEIIKHLEVKENDKVS